MNTNPAVVYDACVLYPAPLRDLLVELGGLAQDWDWFRVKWTDEIHNEWIRNLLENRPDLTREQLTRTRDLMNRHIDDCLVTGYAHRIESLKLPDENDRHVLAAAIECGASIIVTANLEDFPAEAVQLSGIKAMSADDFICDFLDTHEEAAEKMLEEAVRAIKRRLKNPALSWNQYFACLENMDGNELTNTVQRLRGIIPAEEVTADDLLFATNTAAEG
jgi:PIN domain